MKILDHKQIIQKVKRLAYQLVENHIDGHSIYLIGVNINGYHVANLLKNEIVKLTSSELKIVRVSIPKDCNSSEVSLDSDFSPSNESSVIIVDDVANTGKTIYYAFKPLLEFNLKQLKVVALIDRKHKAFPIHVDYVGLSLATTFENHITVDFTNPYDLAAYLK